MSATGEAVDPLFLGLLLPLTMSASWRWPTAAEKYRPVINAASGKHSVPATLLARMLYTESRFRADIIDGTVKSTAGALGIAQFMPATAKALGVDPLKPESAIPGAARYLRTLKNRFGSWRYALMAYNWGEGNVAQAIKGAVTIPAAVEAYADDILFDVFT